LVSALEKLSLNPIVESVKYRNEIEHLRTSLDFDPRLLANLFLQKSEYWRYEQEVRIIVPQKTGPTVLPFDVIEAIVLGCEMPEEDAFFIENFITRLNPRISLLIARKKENRFELEIKPIDASAV